MPAEIMYDVVTQQPTQLETPVMRATDPAISNVATPGDFAAQYPQPLDTAELLQLCEEVSLLQAIPEMYTSLNGETWREMSALAFTSGSNYFFFEDGTCAEENTHTGSNTTINSKTFGTKKSLKVSDIMHSRAIAAAGWNGINQLVGGPSNVLPGSAGAGTFQREFIADLKEKEMRLGATLVLNGWDKMLVSGNTDTSSNQFSGLENYESNQSVTFYSNTYHTTGTFSAAEFDSWLGDSCAPATHVFGHPSAIQGLLSAYFQLGFQGSQVIQKASGDRIVPGFNFASFVNTGIGRVQVVGDRNFTRTATYSNNYSYSLYAMRMSHNGEPLVYRMTQIPFGVTDLVPGCTAVSFQIWAKSALVIKHACAQGKYTTVFANPGVSGGCSLVG